MASIAPPTIPYGTRNEPTGVPYDPASPRVRDARYPLENGSSIIVPGPRNYPYDSETPPSITGEEPTGIPYDPASPQIRDALYTSEKGTSTLFPGPRNYPYDPASPPLTGPIYRSGDEGHALRFCMRQTMDAFRASKQTERLAQTRNEAGLAAESHFPAFRSSPLMIAGGSIPGGHCLYAYPGSGNGAKAGDEGSLGEGENITARAALSELQIRSRMREEHDGLARGDEKHFVENQNVRVDEEETGDWVLVERIPA